ncbi:hypothetical protein HQ524_02745 [Candidatus Uhrbacteria bacterium]|nr:hypothetical protein [Candidatus Uhrbacteria bacterium]
MKVFLRYVLPLLAIAAVFVFMFMQSSGPKQVVSDTAVSEDGTSELVDFYKAISEQQFEQAAQYIQPDCSNSRCFVEDIKSEDIADYLRTMCETNVCDPIEIDSVGNMDNNNLYVHTVAFLDDNGGRERLCITEDCRVQKVTFALRVVNIGNQWFVTDPPPTKY